MPMTAAELLDVHSTNTGHAGIIDEQAEINAEERRKAAAGRRVPHVLRSARRAGLLAPDILQALDLQDHPLITGAQKAPEEAD